MSSKFKSLSLFLAASIFSTAAFSALPEGPFEGNSSLMSYEAMNTDAMAMLIRKDTMTEKLPGMFTLPRLKIPTVVMI
jgi:hypothetical protein